MIHSSEGVEETGAISMSTVKAACEIFIEKKMFETIPALVEQVRISEEQYILEGNLTEGSIASLCARTVRELIEMKYGPIRGLEHTPPVSNGKWRW